MSQTIIPTSAKITSNSTREAKGKSGVKFVGSRQGGPEDQKMTTKASIKHENPEFFKRQSDQKKADQFGFQMKKNSRSY